MVKTKGKNMKVTDTELVAYIIDELVDVRTSSYDSLSDQRIQSNYSFVNVNTDTTTPTTGMSRVKFFFTPSVVNTLTMYQSKIFCSDKETVVFNPVNKEEGQLPAAKQAQAMVNNVLHKQNPGFEIITELFRSAAVNKNSVAKVTWVESPDMFEEVLEDFDELSLQQLTEQREADGYTVKTMSSDNELGNYTLRFEKMKGKIQIDILPPEEFLINEDTTSITSPLTRFVGHRRELMKGEVAAMFPKVNVDDLSSDSFLTEDYEKRARHSFDDTWNRLDGEGGGDPTTKKLELVESWIRCDRDGDGFPEWRHCFTCGATLLEDEEWFGPVPFAHYTFFPVPHKFYGLSVYDRLRTYEETATGLVRADVDMSRLKNTFRILAKEGTIDRRNLQSGKPGVIPVSNTFTPNDVMALPTPQGSSNTTALLAELRQQVIADIGIDPVSGQVSTDIEKSGNDSAKTAMALDNASVKLEGYARRFAETTLKDIIWLILIELVKHEDDEFVQNILNSITPDIPFIVAEEGLDNVMSKSDLTAKVGLGHQTSQQKAQAAGVVSGMILQLSQQPSMAMYNITSEALKGFGYDNPEALLGPLDEWVQKAQQAQQAQQSQIEAAQSQQQLAQQQFQLQEQQVQGQLQIAQIESQARIQREAAESEAKISQMQSKAELDQAKTDDLEVETGIKLATPITEGTLSV